LQLLADRVLLREQRVALCALDGEARGIAYGRFMRRTEILELRVHAEMQPGDDGEADHPATGHHGFGPVELGQLRLCAATACTATGQSGLAAPLLRRAG